MSARYRVSQSRKERPCTGFEALVAHTEFKKSTKNFLQICGTMPSACATKDSFYQFIEVTKQTPVKECRDANTQPGTGKPYVPRPCSVGNYPHPVWEHDDIVYNEANLGIVTWFSSDRSYKMSSIHIFQMKPKVVRVSLAQKRGASSLEASPKVFQESFVL